MTTSEFCYWLQGFLELSKSTSLNEEQLEAVKKHLALALTNVTQKTVTQEQLRNALKNLPNPNRKYC